jgi:hypothetical protein
MVVRRVITVVTVSATIFATGAVPVLAHDCFNPTKNEHAPTAGVHYTITGFGETGPELEKTAQGKGNGGFIALSPEATGAPETLYVHTLGNLSKENGHETVGGPGSEKPQHACNGKGIDYLGACFGEGP